MTAANRVLLDEVNQAAAWFRARKISPIWVKEIPNGQIVESVEGSVRVLEGDFLCRGDGGDLWPQSAKHLLAKYQPTDQLNSEGWTKYEPRLDQAGVLAAQVRHSFAIDTERGRLRGKAGDYLLKDDDDADARYPRRLWIVDRKLFNATYKRDNDGS